MSDEWSSRPRGRLRSGYTTGACATAATVGALRALLARAVQERATIRLPTGEEVTFPLASCAVLADHATAAVVKDAGDDPDCTHGALLVATVRLLPEEGVAFRRGRGVGLVTRPGLPLPVGEPAINPAPRRMMAEHARAVLREFGRAGEGVEITVSCPGGELLAERTANPRLGIVGGISILGTTGVVRPYSASSYIASIVQALDVGIAAGLRAFVVTVGGKSERAARALFPEMPDLAFLQMGVFLGPTLSHAARTRRVDRLTFVGMAAKFVKAARGALTLEGSPEAVTADCALLAELAREAGAPAELVSQIRAAPTLREAEASLAEAGVVGVYDLLAARCVQTARRVVLSRGAATPAVDVILIDDQGRVVGRCETP